MFRFDQHDVFHCIGLLWVGVIAVRIVFFLYKRLLRSPVNITQSFGGKWALVTGATDGIGKAYAFELAKRGMNVILVSRSMSKLSDVAEEIRLKNGVEVKTVVVDFVHDDEGAYRIKVAREIENLPVAVLVNNVGMSYQLPGSFLEIDDNLINSLVKCNIGSVNNMTSLILPQMVERGSGVIVNLSSLAGTLVTPLYIVYSATKAYVDFFSRGLEFEYRSKGITVQCLTPGYVVSNMSKLSKPSIMAPMPEDFVKSALARLGIESKTTGYWMHDLMSYFLNELVPQGLANKLVYDKLSALRRRGLKKLNQKKSE